ncbi:MAG: sigma 54-interacting transcriptional regulator [Alphaproteobacteria bacterium]|nr:sigma 54-interacting transcriptional regulator [Alphaproteobacteria bacterium]
MAYLRCHDPIRRTTVELPLKKPLVTIGRKDGNDIVLDDSTVSATHANLLRQGGRHSISVLDRGNELYVNGKLARQATLAAGDRVLIGRFELTLMDGDPPAADLEPVVGAVGTDQLQRLVDFSAQLMREPKPEKVFQALLHAVVDLTGAEKGFVIVFRDGQRHLAASHNVGQETLDLSRVSDSIIDRVVEHRQPIIVSDAMSDRTFGRSRSVVDLKLSSVMCVPLLYRNDLLGVLYLGNDAITGLFTDADLAMLQVWASQASMIVHAALLLDELKDSNRNLRAQLRRSSQGEIVGSSPPMKQVFKLLRKLGPTDLSVLVLGETGTGKELVARELHQLSERSKKPFISINCGAIPENLLESELFGHKKGAFTGAVTDKIGKFEAADGGTLFLDEIGEMPMNLQVKLLRVLQERVIERVGDLRPRPVDIRVISATNKDLEEEIAAGRFREDLFYRLNEVTISLPALRERGEDVHQLARFFLQKYADQYDSKARGFTNECIRAMLNYYWPGNVRQLENRVKKGVIMSDRALLNADDLSISATTKRDITPLDEATEDFKKRHIQQALELNNWNKAQTARDLGVDPRTIFRYIEKMDD